MGCLVMGSKEKNFVSAVVYVHNAENRIESFLKTIIDIMQHNFDHSEIICVNDCSDDNSIGKVKEVSSQIASATSISVINMSYFHGLELAMNAGVDLAIGDFVFEFDNTILDFEESDVMKIYHRALDGYDIVNAAPCKKEKFTSGFFYKTFMYYTNQSNPMSTESFRILSRRVINRISSMNKTVPYRKAVYVNCGLKTDLIKYDVKMIEHIKYDKYEKNYRTGLAIDALILFTDFGYKLSMTMTVLMMLVAAFMLVYSIVVNIMLHPVAGWTTTILFLSVAFFGLFGVLTIVIKYLQILVDLVFKRKHYSFESVEKLTE